MIDSANKLPRWLVLGLAFPLAVINGWLFLQVFRYFQPLVSIFVAAILLAFILDYPIQFLEKQGLKRNYAAVGVLLSALLILIALGITLVPIILVQLNELINILPSWIDSGRSQLQAFQNWALENQLPINLTGLATQLIDRLSSQIQNLTARAFGFALDTIGSVLNVVLTLVITFYLLLNSQKIWDGIFKWLPESFSILIRRSLRQNFNNYFIGQATIATIVGTAMTSAFLLLRVPLGLLFGIGIGFLALFPFGAGVGIALVSLLVALQNFWLGLEVLAVAVAIDQVNGNFIAPRVLGGFTGLNPVWIVVSLLLGAKLGGLLGLLIAVPVASFIKTTADSLRAVSLDSDEIESLSLDRDSIKAAQLLTEDSTS